MNTWVRRSLQAGALTAGAVMATGTAAHADTTQISADNTGILNGTQLFAPIQAPINLCGNAVSVLGEAQAGCEGGSAASIEGLYDVKMLSAGNTGILNGTQVFLPIQAPINLCGNAVSVLGKADAGCEGGASATLGGHHGDCGCDGDHHGNHDGHHPYSHHENATEGQPKAEVLGGLPVVGQLTQGGLPVVGQLSGLTSNLPLVGSLPLVGDLIQGGLGQPDSLPVVGPMLGNLLGGGALGGNVLGGDALGGDILGGGNGGNAVDVNQLDSVGTVSPSGESVHVTESEGEGGTGGGHGCGTTCPPQTPPPSQTPPPVPVPHNPPCPPQHHHGSHDGKDVKMVSTGNVGILNGTQIYAPIQVPIDISGNAVAILGKAAAHSGGGASAHM